LRGQDRLKEKKYYPAITNFNLAKKLIADIEARGGMVGKRDKKTLEKLTAKAKKKFDQQEQAKGNTGKRSNLSRLKDVASTGKPAKRVSIFLFGLDRAGKTTLVEYLKQEKFMDHAPTLGINLSHVTLGNVKFEFNDLGGQKAFRPNWMDYWKKPDLMIFMIDAADSARLNESRDALWSVLEKPETAGKSLLILSNKIDLPEARRLDVIKDTLEIKKMSSRIVACYEVSVKENMNVEKALNFIASFVLADDEMNQFVSGEMNRLSRTLKEVYKAFVKEAKILEREGQFEKALNRVHKAKFIQDELFNNGFSKAQKKALKCVDWMGSILKEMNTRGIMTEGDWWNDE
ncbi:MAG: ADP-ribosylation factor-like protein, partial [Promethearchaeota archaeon]